MPKNFRRLSQQAILTAVIIACSSGFAYAKELRYATGYPPNSIGSVAGDRMAEAMKDRSDSKLTAKVFASSLLDLKEAPSGIGMGMADMGLVVTQYFPSDFPTTNFLADLSLSLTPKDVADDTFAYAYGGAMAEFLFTNCPNCEKEYGSQNQVALTGSSSPPYHLVCTTPIRSAADIKGKRLRVSGAVWSRWAEYVGASTVSMPQSESYEALSQGVVDCVTASAPELINFKLIEVVTDITPSLPGGLFSGLTNTINKNLWTKLSKDDRKTVLRGAAAFSASMTRSYIVDAQEAMDLVTRKDKIKIHNPDEGLLKITDKFISSDIEVLKSRYSERYKKTDISKMITDFKTVLDSWIIKIDNARPSSEEELMELYWKEIYSKVDLDQYGL